MVIKGSSGWMPACAAALVMCISAHAAELKSPDQVRNALRILAYVQDDMNRKLPTKSFSRLPHENEEFQEAAPALRDAVVGEPAAFKTQVEGALKSALVAANAVAEVSKSNDEVKITASVAAVADALTHLNALFPEALRPVAGQLGSGPPRSGAGGPPPGLR
ncbi:MAG: hypothetical protein ABI859_03745 [Pseudomonadota bacterium]